MRAAFLGAVYGGTGLVMAWGLVLVLQSKRFLRETPTLRTQADLDAFKRIASTSMYGALATVVLLLAPWILYFMGRRSGAIAGSDVLHVTGTSLALLLWSVAVRRFEKRVQSVEAADADMARFRDHVREIWKSKPFPTW